jgi:hypothetical protein
MFPTALGACSVSPALGVISAGESERTLGRDQLPADPV